jgi:glycosyltransferase involved in cell wall biosynthesis
MNVTAVLAIRNEEAYLANCLRDLISNGLDFAVIDNDSTDSSAQIYGRSEFAAHLVRVCRLPFSGAFSLSEQLQRKMEIIKALNSDWVVHVDADEIMHSYREGEGLREALSRLDAEGWNVVNFDEFVFLPIERDYQPEACGHQPISYYYFFQPSSPRRMLAWKRDGGFSCVEFAGHLLAGSNLRLAPEHFAMRHYIVRSQKHAFQKYATRSFAAEEVVRGWHGNRIGQPIEAFRLPPVTLLKKLAEPSIHDLDRSDPWTQHYWQLRPND